MGELRLNAIKHHALSADMVFVNTETGTSFGRMTIESWSPEVTAKLRELMAAMEADAERLVFEQVRSTAVSMESEKGIGEIFSDDSAPPA